MPQKHREREHRIAVIVCHEYSQRTLNEPRTFTFEWRRADWTRIHEVILRASLLHITRYGGVVENVTACHVPSPMGWAQQATAVRADVFFAYSCCGRKSTYHDLLEQIGERAMKQAKF